MFITLETKYFLQYFNQILKVVKLVICRETNKIQQTLNLNNKENPKEYQSLKIKFLTFSSIIQLPSWYIYIFLSQSTKKKIIIMFSQYLPFFSYFLLLLNHSHELLKIIFFYCMFFFINISAALEFHLIYLMYYLMMFYLFFYDTSSSMHIAYNIHSYIKFDISI